jgi:CRP/FNR family transcriptional regulator, cyclic AMP receptor protein
MSIAIVDVLGRSDAFGSLEETERVRLASACHARAYASGQIVFLRGDKGDCMYVVGSGAVSISLAGDAGRDVLLAVLGPDASFGELAVVDSGPRVATVTARSSCVLVVVPRRAVTELIARVPSVATALLLAMAAMVRRLDEQAADATLLDLPRRVQKYLATAANERIASHAARSGDFVAVDVALTQGDLARLVGGSRQQVNRILMGLEAAGSIERLGHRIVGIRPELLLTDI